jgi:hypothetical protein
MLERGKESLLGNETIKKNNYPQISKGIIVTHKPIWPIFMINIRESPSLLMIKKNCD